MYEIKLETGLVRDSIKQSLNWKGTENKYDGVKKDQ